MNPHPYWDRHPLPARAWMPAQEMQRFHFVLMLVKTALLLVAFAGFFVLWSSAGKYPQVRVVAYDGSMSLLQPELGFPSGEAFTKAITTIVEATFYRTEKGPVKGVEKYHRRGLMTQLSANYDPNNQEYQSGFLQRFKVESMEVAQSTATFKELHFTGMFISRSGNRSQADRVTIGAAFESVPMTADNPVGWELTGLALPENLKPTTPAKPQKKS